MLVFAGVISLRDRGIASTSNRRACCRRPAECERSSKKIQDTSPENLPIGQIIFYDQRIVSRKDDPSRELATTVSGVQTFCMRHPISGGVATARGYICKPTSRIS